MHDREILDIIYSSSRIRLTMSSSVVGPKDPIIRINRKQYYYCYSWTYDDQLQHPRHSVDHPYYVRAIVRSLR